MTSTQYNELFGRVRICVPFEAGGIPTGISIGGKQASRAAEFITSDGHTEPVAFDIGVRVAVLVREEAANANNTARTVDFSDLQFAFVAAP